jgi:hypothetical protein
MAEIRDKKLQLDPLRFRPAPPGGERSLERGVWLYPM